MSSNSVSGADIKETEVMNIKIETKKSLSSEGKKSTNSFS